MDGSEQWKLLLKIGMRFETKKYASNRTWDEWYKIAQKYYEEHGNLEVPKNYVTKDGEKLGQWISCQRKDTKPESQKGFLLSKIGMLFKIRKRTYNRTWDEWYKIAQKYYEEHGNLEISDYFVTDDGENLGNWIRHQRQDTNSESKKGLLLSKIGMRFEKKKIQRQWNEWYEIAKKYYEKHNNLKVPMRFITEEGEKLGQWITNQRQAYNGKGKSKITEEQIALLSKIGMIWNLKKNEDDVKSICEIYGINYNKNKTSLEYISVQELKSKIEFLMENKIPIVDENGQLMDIFNMSSYDMKEKYELTLEEMISKYYIDKQSSKGV